MTKRKKKAVQTEFHTVKRIDNSRLVRAAEPVRMEGFYRTAGWSGVIAIFLMFYVYQHFRCIDLSFQLEDLKARQTKTLALNLPACVMSTRMARNNSRLCVVAWDFSNSQ